jgi:hypothetical protein
MLRAPGKLPIMCRKADPPRRNDRSQAGFMPFTKKRGEMKRTITYIQSCHTRQEQPV